MTRWFLRTYTTTASPAGSRHWQNCLVVLGIATAGFILYHALLSFLDAAWTEAAMGDIVHPELQLAIAAASGRIAASLTVLAALVIVSCVEHIPRRYLVLCTLAACAIVACVSASHNALLRSAMWTVWSDCVVDVEDLLAEPVERVLSRRGYRVKFVGPGSLLISPLAPNRAEEVRAALDGGDLMSEAQSAKPNVAP